MAITLKTRSTLVTEVVGYFRTRFSTRNLGTEGFLGKIARALAMLLWGFQNAAQDASEDYVPDENTSTSGLDRWAESIGLPNGNGSYGRKVATPATGGTALATGTPGTVIPDGTQATAEDGETIVETTGGPFTVGGGGTITVNLDAVSAGAAGNLESGALIQWLSPPAGLDSTCDITGALSGGADEESDADLLVRIQARLRNPPKGGTASDYRTWCENAEDTNGDAVLTTARAYVYPRRSGTGSVDVVLTKSGTGTARAASAGEASDTQTYLDGVRPVTVEAASVMLPYQPAGAGHILAARVTFATDYALDWSDGGTSMTYKSLPASTQIEINGAAPAALIAAVADGPTRIVLVNTSATAPVVCKVYTVTSINTAGADDILTVSAAVTPTPTLNDAIYAAGPATEAVEQAMVDYVDSLGPSKAGGYADTVTDAWSDTIAVAGVTHAVMDAHPDADDADKYVVNITSGFPTIDGAQVDITAADAYTTAPQLSYATRALVRG